MKSAVYYTLWVFSTDTEEGGEKTLNPDFEFNKLLYECDSWNVTIDIPTFSGRELFYSSSFSASLLFLTKPLVVIMSTASLYRRFLPSPPAIDFASVEGKVRIIMEIEIKVFFFFFVICLWSVTIFDFGFP